MMMVQDRAGAGYQRARAGATFGMMMGAHARQPQSVSQVFSLFNTGSPAHHGRRRPRQGADDGRPAGDGRSTRCGTYLGSTYVNDFNLLGRTFRVTAQAEPTLATTSADIAQPQGRARPPAAMVPLGSVANLQRRHRPVAGGALQPASRPPRSQGEAAPGRLVGPGAARPWRSWRPSSAAAGLQLRVDRARLPGKGGGQLAAPRSSRWRWCSSSWCWPPSTRRFTLPLAVILIVPMCILAAMLGVNLRGHGQQHPDPDRPDRAGRPGGQERHPDRGIRQAGGGA